MRSGRAVSRTPYVLVMTYGDDAGAWVRVPVMNFQKLPRALEAARRGNRVWRDLVPSWRWPPSYHVIDVRSGEEHSPHLHIEGGAHRGTT